MSMLEAAIFFGVLSLIVDGLGVVIARATGLPYALPMCLSFLITVVIIMVTGFVAARYAAVVNGVWAGIMVAAINSVFSQLIYMGTLPEYREAMRTSAETQQAIPVGVLGFVIVLYVLSAAVGAIVAGAFFGFIGAAISQLGVFRPQDSYADEH